MGIFGHIKKGAKKIAEADRKATEWGRRNEGSLRGLQGDIGDFLGTPEPQKKKKKRYPEDDDILGF